MQSLWLKSHFKASSKQVSKCSEVPNEQADQNKQVWREDILIYYMKVLGKSFSFVTHEKLKVCEK